MSNEHQPSHSAPGFGKNSNGLGLLIVAVAAVVIAAIAFNFWKSGAQEQRWYRFENKAATSEGHEGEGKEMKEEKKDEGHEGEGKEMKEEKKEEPATAVADSTAGKADSNATKMADTTAPHH
jgi:hypothetical protein